jgi:glycerate 2-kinase
MTTPARRWRASSPCRYSESILSKSVSSPRHHALQIFRAALQAADPYRAVLAHMSFDGRVLKTGGKRYRLDAFDRIQVIGAGKAGASMARAVERLLGRRISGGFINVPDGVSARLHRIQLHPCGHPIPDERGAEGARRILEIARSAGPRDLLIALISGGASAMLPAPAPPLMRERPGSAQSFNPAGTGSLKDKQALTRQLLASGATIQEMNTVRKHLSLIKGGQLAQAASPATVIALLLSDVVGDDPGVIGSGPTVPDSSTVADAVRILEKYGVSVAADALHETPKPGDPVFARSHHVVVGSNRQAIAAAEACSRKLGYRTMVLSTTIEGETREIARMHAAIAREILSSNRPIRRPSCLLSGGETTVTVRGRGLGGRNQEFVLAALLALEGGAVDESFTILSAGTDGIDGPTDAAGAIADASTLTRAASLGLDARRFLDDNDSYRFFEPLDALLKTGPTGTNVADVRVLLLQ